MRWVKLDRVAAFAVDANSNASVVARALIPWRLYTNALVMAADTVVILNDNFNGVSFGF
jgi:hypothetical protein